MFSRERGLAGSSGTRVSRQLGFSVLAVDYRGFGKSSDVAPDEAHAYDDAEAAWDYLAKLAPGRSRYIVGYSLDGAIAVELIRRRPDAAGLVLEATFTSVRDIIAKSPLRVLRVRLILTQQFDTLANLPAVKTPVLIAHGTNDTVVPFEMGERLYKVVQAPKKFIKVQGAGHHNLSSLAFAEYRRALAELFGIDRSL